MQSWQKEITKLGIAIVLFMGIMGFCGCQKTSSDTMQSKDVQAQGAGTESGDAFSSAYEGEEKGRDVEKWEDYITPEDVTEEDSLAKASKAETDDIGKEDAEQTSSNQTDRSKEQDTKTDTASSRTDKEKNSSSEGKNSGKDGSSAASDNERISKESNQNHPMEEDKQNLVNSKDEAAKQVEKPQCSFTIECKDVLNHKDQLKKNKQGLIPEKGIIYSNQNTAFSEGESVFDILLRITKNNKIQMEYNYTPAFQSNYVEGIANLYEFDCGELSGWSYLVNGQSPNYGCNRYMVKEGDEIIWRYTCGN